MKHLVLILILMFVSAVAHGAEEDRLAELDAYWAEVSRCVKEGDFKGYEKTIHKDGVIVAGKGKKCYPLEDALKKWKIEFDQTKEGVRQSSAEFRFNQRLGDETTAHETGILLYKAVTKEGKNVEAYIDFQALLLKRRGRWQIMMEYQVGPTTKEAWSKLGDASS
jgi:hypothetical protein